MKHARRFASVAISTSLTLGLLTVPNPHGINYGLFSQPAFAQSVDYDYLRQNNWIAYSRANYSLWLPTGFQYISDNVVAQGIQAIFPGVHVDPSKIMMLGTVPTTDGITFLAAVNPVQASGNMTLQRYIDLNSETLRSANLTVSYSQIETINGHQIGKIFFSNPLQPDLQLVNFIIQDGQTFYEVTYGVNAYMFDAMYDGFKTSLLTFRWQG